MLCKCDIALERYSTSPLIWKNWSRELSFHPDKAYTQYILRGISQGFMIGHNCHHHLCQSHSIMLSQNPEVISHYLNQEVSLARMTVLPTTQSKDIRTSPISAISKKNKPGKWRLIVYLPSPSDRRVNDGVSSEWSSVSYPTIDHLSYIVLNQGRGAFLVKTNINEAYWMDPMHTQHQCLLGVQWKSNTYVHLVFPLDYILPLIIYSAVADGIQ